MVFFWITYARQSFEKEKYSLEADTGRAHLKSVLKNFAKFTGKHLWWRLFLNKVAGINFIKRETPAQVFSCGFCEDFKNTWADRGDCFWAVLMIVYNFKVISSRGTLAILLLQLTFHSEPATATKIWSTKNTSTNFQKVFIWTR